MNRSGTGIEKKIIVTRFLIFLFFFIFHGPTCRSQNKKKIQKEFYGNQILYISKNCFIFHGPT